MLLIVSHYILFSELGRQRPGVSLKPEASVIKTFGIASDMIVQNSLLMSNGKTADCKATTPLTSRALRSRLCEILMRHKWIYQAFSVLCRDNSVMSETPASTEASRDCLNRVTTRGPRSRPHTTAGLHIWTGIAFQVCRNSELLLIGECLAGAALSICAPKGKSLCSILIDDSYKASHAVSS